MKRKIYNDLLAWKESGMKKPLMIIGARQIGKTYIAKEFCEKDSHQVMSPWVKVPLVDISGST